MTKKQIKELFKADSCNKDLDNWYKKFKSFKLPKCNGKPQIWLRGTDNNEGLRIIYPNGKVEYTAFSIDIFLKGCTSAKTQEQALMKCLAYDSYYNGTWDNIEPIFIGYIN